MRSRTREEIDHVRKINFFVSGLKLRSGGEDGNYIQLRETVGLVSKERKCLRCDKGFPSQSRSNRICNHCAQNPLTVCTRHGDASMAVKFGKMS
jgi:hypothetical protein